MMDFNQGPIPIVGFRPRVIIPINAVQAMELKAKRLTELAEEERLNSCPLVRMKTNEYKMGLEYSKQYVNEQFWGQIRNAAEQGLGSYKSYTGGPATGQTQLQSICYLEGLMDGCISELRSKGFEVKAKVTKVISYGSTRLDIEVSW